MFNITSKYFNFFNNKPPASWVAHITRDFLTCYSCSCYSYMVKSSKQKQRLYKIFLKNRNLGKELNYKQYKTLFEALKKKTRKNYYSDLIDSYKWNIEKKRGFLWRKLLETKETPMCLFPILLSVYSQFYQHQSYDLELENSFASVKTNKSSGYDDKSADVVKKVSNEILVILKHIINISLAKRIFPNNLKLARVTTFL